MAPKNTSEVLIQSNNKNQCNNDTADVPINTDAKHSLTSTRDNFELFNKLILNDFSNGFGGIKHSIFDDSFYPIGFGHWSYGHNSLPDTPERKGVTIKNEKDRLEIVFDTNGFRKEDIKISTLGQTLRVEGSHEEKSNDGKKCVSNQFSRSYTLPEDCKMGQMKSTISNDNQLAISIPRKDLKVENITIRQIPIELNEKTASLKNKTFQSTKQQREEATEGTLHDCQTRIDVKLPPSNFSSRCNEDVPSTKLENVAEMPASRATKMHNLHQTSNWMSLTPNWFRPIQLFDQDDSFVHTNRPFSFTKNIFNEISEPSNARINRNMEVKEDDKQFKFTLSLEDYKPSELKVSVTDNILKIEGRHENDDSNGKFMSRKFVRSYALPKEYKMDQVQSSLTRSGQLTVTIPRDNALPNGSKVIIVPIKME